VGLGKEEGKKNLEPQPLRPRSWTAFCFTSSSNPRATPASGKKGGKRGGEKKKKTALFSERRHDARAVAGELDSYEGCGDLNHLVRAQRRPSRIIGCHLEKGGGKGGKKSYFQGTAGSQMASTMSILAQCDARHDGKDYHREEEGKEKGGKKKKKRPHRYKELPAADCARHRHLDRFPAHRRTEGSIVEGGEGGGKEGGPPASCSSTGADAVPPSWPRRCRATISRRQPRLGIV